MSGIQEIACATGLSKSTVSRALRGLPGVAAPTIAAVRRVAEEVGYVPSSAAAGLATGRQRAIGVVVPVIDRWFYVKTLEGVDAELRRDGYDLVLYSLGGGSSDRERAFHRSMLRRRIDALVLLSLVFDESEREQLELTEYPMVVVGGPAPGVRHIGIDDRGAARLATTHLLDLGHRDVAYIGGQDEAGMNVAVPYLRRDGFRDTMRASGIEPAEDRMLDGGFSYRGGYGAMRRLLQRRPVPTAVFAASDEMALGAITALAEASLRVPEDVSVIAIDGHEHGAVVGLTTVAQDPSEQGRTAARALLDELGGAQPMSAFAPAAARLVVRSSTGPPARLPGVF
ncbi:LacI family DNA-binding transcriptional regulator [Curtobacterium sp. Leaf261]|uniref:LacI family DNA-binding transcriptional regulator n=1 Tax=Curtobacterium sp. Leaf261 TaxID=1736311 RepID=UPI0006FC5545|nr:LacI family DNA-binding transcriptional regulator [Curtobacterium sp. Leaf261]KQO60263.1 LacI family transcriptional regulator [Curtobacterium sp. Leaf261]